MEAVHVGLLELLRQQYVDSASLNRSLANHTSFQNEQQLQTSSTSLILESWACQPIFLPTSLGPPFRIVTLHSPNQRITEWTLQRAALLLRYQNHLPHLQHAPSRSSQTTPRYLPLVVGARVPSLHTPTWMSAPKIAICIAISQRAYR